MANLSTRVEQQLQRRQTDATTDKVRETGYPRGPFATFGDAQAYRQAHAVWRYDHTKLDHCQALLGATSDLNAWLQSCQGIIIDRSVFAVQGPSGCTKTAVFTPAVAKCCCKVGALQVLEVRAKQWPL